MMNFLLLHLYLLNQQIDFEDNISAEVFKIAIAYIRIGD